jgi:uncharacterized protein (TIGR04551 family)
MNNSLFGLLVATSVAVWLGAPAAAAQTGETTDPAASSETTTEPDGTVAEGTAAEGTAVEGVAGESTPPVEPVTSPPQLTPPDESFYGETPANPPPPPEGTAGTEGAAGTAGTEGTSSTNPAEALLSASREDREDQQAEQDAEQVSWQEEASRFIELKGYFRTRGDLFYQLHLGRNDGAAFPHPYDDAVTQNGTACTGTAGETCFTNDTYASGNLRLRLEPVIHVQVYATIDLLDNLVLGSTPDGYANQPGADGGYDLSARSPWVPLRAFSSTQVPPNGGINSFGDSVTVKRAWAEVTTPVGRLMFGRMQSQWGLGVLANGGNDIDSDYGDLADRIMWAARYQGLVGALGFDFAGEGPTSQAIFELQGQPWDLGQLDDVNQYVAVLGYRPTEEEQLARLRSGSPAFAGGLYYVFRNQVLSSESTDALGDQGNLRLVQRDAFAHIFDAWFQFRWERFRAETEWTVIYGGIKNIELGSFSDAPYDILQFGGVLQLEYTLLGQPTVRSNRLRLGLEGGYASGDPNQEGLSPREGLLTQHAGAGDHTLSTFRFDPDYNVDLILFEQILGQVTGAYYVRPWVDYTLGLGAGRSKKFLTFRLDVLWSRASEFVSTFSNAADLGLEIDAAVTFETADNFIARLQYGVFFPFGAFEDLPGTRGQFDLSNAQTVQALLGVTF